MKQNFKRLTILIHPELFTDLKIVTAMRNITMSSYVERLLVGAMRTELEHIKQNKI